MDQASDIFRTILNGFEWRHDLTRYFSARDWRISRPSDSSYLRFDIEAEGRPLVLLVINEQYACYHQAVLGYLALYFMKRLDLPQLWMAYRHPYCKAGLGVMACRDNFILGPTGEMERMSSYHPVDAFRDKQGRYHLIWFDDCDGRCVYPPLDRLDDPLDYSSAHTLINVAFYLGADRLLWPDDGSDHCAALKGRWSDVSSNLSCLPRVDELDIPGLVMLYVKYVAELLARFELFPRSHQAYLASWYLWGRAGALKHFGISESADEGTANELLALHEREIWLIYVCDHRCWRDARLPPNTDLIASRFLIYALTDARITGERALRCLPDSLQRALAQKIIEVCGARARIYEGLLELVQGTPGSAPELFRIAYTTNKERTCWLLEIEPQKIIDAEALSCRIASIKERLTYEANHLWDKNGPIYRRVNYCYGRHFSH